MKIKQSKQTAKQLFIFRKPQHIKRLAWIIIILLAGSIPLIINYLYMLGSDLQEPNTAFSASDLLSFYGAVLTFLGTTFLGLVAYQQNEAHNQKQLELDKANTLTPFLTIDSVFVSKKEPQLVPFETNHYNVPGKKAIVTIKNIGQGLATMVTYKHWFGELLSPEDDQKSINLSINETFTIPVFTDENSIDKMEKIEIKYQNIIGFQYQQTLNYKLVHEYEQINECDWEDRYFLHIYLMGTQQRISLRETTIDNGN